MEIEKNGLLYSAFENISLTILKKNRVKHVNEKTIIIFHNFRCNIFTVTVLVVNANINKKCNGHNDDKK